MLAVEPDVMITVQPEDATVLAGQTATFKVEAKGQGLTYKWQRRTGPTDSWKDISGATSASYTTSEVNKSHNGYHYRIIITDGYGNSVTSGIATLYISVSPNTGDSRNPVLYACLAILSIAVGLLLFKKRRAA
jgi:LPXTG-motif cell wall-anchored protein